MKLPQNPTDKELEEFNQRQLFVRDAMPAQWLEYAEDLGDAAEALWAADDNSIQVVIQSEKDGSATIKKTTGHSRSYILLAGLALENVLKAVLVANDPTLINTGSLAKAMHSHDLHDLARRITNLSLDEEAQDILRTCQDAIPYWGRYPIPLSYGGLKPSVAATPDFRDKFRELHRMLCKRVYDAVKNGWDSGVGPEVCSVQSVRYGDQIDPLSPLP